MARSIEEIEKEIAQLPPEQLVRFRAWFEKFDAREWDEQIEQDLGTGKLDSLAESAIADHLSGKSKIL